jgi:hypothetical protein
MGEVFGRPSLTVLEVAWRWFFGIPFLFVCYCAANNALNKMEFAGIGTIDSGNPWLAARQIANICHIYQPLAVEFLVHVLPLAAVSWILISSLGRGLVLQRMLPRITFRPPAIIFLQAAWLGLFAMTLWGWYSAMSWVAAIYIEVGGEPDLIGFSIWTIFLSLGFFTAFALMSWTVSIAPLLALLEDRSALSALGESFRLGRAFTGKLVEINLVMGIVKLALMVLAMVFSAAPLPFSDELGPEAMHVVWGASMVFYLVANDYFQVVRLRAFVEFWRVYRGQAAAA